MIGKTFSTTVRPRAASDHELCLIGATRLSDFVDFVQQRSSQRPRPKTGDLADTWRAAAEVYRQLQIAEAGIANSVPVVPLSASLQVHMDALCALPHFSNTFSAVPVAFGMVELDRLVVCQQHLTLSSIESLQARYKRKPSGKALANICLPTTVPPMEFNVLRRHDDEFVFRSNNHDARVLGSRVLTGDAMPDMDVPGHTQAVACIALGFSSNVLNVVRFGQRLVLNNGYHRAYALRAMGVTHVPCVIQVCAHWEEVGLAVGGEMYNNGDPYFGLARPPLLRDFFDKRLVHEIPTDPAERHIRLKFETNTSLWGRPV